MLCSARCFRFAVLLLTVVSVLGLWAGGGGRAWASPLAATPQPVPDTYLLQGVACPAAGFCIAVGQDSSPTGVVVPVTVSGTNVTPGKAQTVAGTTSLAGVACPTAGLCLGVGAANGGGGVVVPLAVSGTSMTPGTVQTVSGTYELWSVACPSADLCVAVGRQGNDGIAVPLGISGSTVTPGSVQTFPDTSDLYRVACPPAAGICVAVGQDFNETFGVVVPLTVSSSTVTLAPAQTVSATAVVLYGVACPTATFCIGVGNGATTGVLAPVTVSGSTVAPGTVQTVSETETLPGAVCPTAGLCLAVGGNNGDTGLVVPLGVSGSTVMAASVQTVSGTFGLIGVACPAAGLCVAVGQSSSSTGVVVALTASNGTTTQLTATQNVSLAGQTITFTATVACLFLPDGSTVQFYDVSTNPPALLGSVSISGGVAVFRYAGLSVGAHSIVAFYEGNAYCSSSTSNPLPRDVLPPLGAVTLTSSVNPSSLTQPVTFTATASCFTTGETISFLDGTTVLGSKSLNTHGVAKLTTSSLSAGKHSLVASYAGDTNCLPADSAPLTQTVGGVPNQGNGLTLTSSANPSALRSPVTFTAKLSCSGYVPGGSVTFYDGTTPLNSTPVPVTAVGQASLKVVTLTAGGHTITATVTGSPCGTLTSPPLSQSVS